MHLKHFKCMNLDDRFTECVVYTHALVPSYSTRGLF